MLQRWIRRALLTLGSLLVLLGIGYGGLIIAVTWREAVAPSTQQVLVLKDGRRVALTQPTAAAAPLPTAVVRQPPAGTPAVLARTAIATAEAAAPAPPTPLPPVQPPRLPPERISIPRINVDWPVVLADNENLPQFKGVGWLMGSGWPGAAGNIVLFGHLGGPNGTFMDLHKLQPGDTFSIFTHDQEYRYRVRSSFETTPDDVAVLAPTDTATATLITCSGPWDPVAQTNQRRLIVVAEYVRA